MGELEKLIRKIVREEVGLYLKELKAREVTGSSIHEETESSPAPLDYELFEEKYQSALKIDDGVNQKYQTQIEHHGKSMTLQQAADLLNMSKQAIRKLSKTDESFPMIFRGNIGTARLMHWLDGGKAYWKLTDSDD